jgi:hypothetical protein
MYQQIKLIKKCIYIYIIEVNKKLVKQTKHKFRNKNRKKKQQQNFKTSCSCGGIYVLKFK